MAGASTSVRKRLPGVAAPKLSPTLPLALLPIAAGLGWLLASHPELYRYFFALGIASVLGLAALRWPKAAILAGLLFLPLVGLIRRLLIESTGWPEVDPLLLIGPILALVLFVKAYALESRPLAPDLLSKLVVALLGLIVLGMVNPLGVGGQAAVVALVLLGVPLLWFFIGRALPDHLTITRLQYGTALLAGGIAIYGLWQTEVGFPSWDLAWIEVGGYGALSVGDQIRGWGTLASASEYAGYLGAGMVFAAAALLHRRPWPIVLFPLLLVAILFSSVRGTLILGVLALVVMLGARSSRPRIVLPTIVLTAIVLYLISAPVLASISTQTGSDLISHQLEGVARPLDDDTSTANAHLTLIGDGVAEGVRHPLGQGIAPAEATAAGSLGHAAAGTEFDISDAFVRFGLPGGLIFLTIAVVAFARIGRNYMETRDPLFLGAIGLAVVTLGTWLSGGHYALTPLLWLILGWATRPPHSGDQQAAPSRISV